MKKKQEMHIFEDQLKEIKRDLINKKSENLIFSDSFTHYSFSWKFKQVYSFITHITTRLNHIQQKQNAIQPHYFLETSDLRKDNF